MAYCENCGTQLSDTAKFCSSCGKAVGSGVASPPTVPSKRSDPATKVILGADAVRPDEQVDKRRWSACRISKFERTFIPPNVSRDMTRGHTAQDRGNSCERTASLLG